MTAPFARDNFLAIATALAFFAMAFLLIFKIVPPENRDLANQLLGALAMKFSTVIDFDFGASKAKGAQPIQPAPAQSPDSTEGKSP